jgi:DNA sulfur modification protein DndB
MVIDVKTLLNTCYISRRLGEQKGYQRTLNMDRVIKLGKQIEKGKILAFPNSILVNCEEPLTQHPLEVSKCPGLITVSLPRSYCSCRVVDGQHRLLGFSRLTERELSRRHLPVIAFQGLNQQDEARLFIDINSKQKRIDSNLIQDLKADFTWDPSQNPKEYAEKTIVCIARKLSSRGPLRNRIFFGRAGETKGAKVTLSTLVSVVRENHLVGGKLHFYQASFDDVDGPLDKIKEVFSLIGRTFRYHSPEGQFLLTNVGLRITFRTLQVLIRHRKIGLVEATEKQFFKDLKGILNSDFIDDLKTLYGTGGKIEGSKRVLEELRKKHPARYESVRPRLPPVTTRQLVQRTKK